MENAENLEQCAGCDRSARKDRGGHPWVGVMNAQDAQDLGYDISGASERGFIDVPVCAECHSDSEHRVRPLKCHFFPKEHRRAAVRAAGAQSIIV